MNISRIGGIYVGLLRTTGGRYYASGKTRKEVMQNLMSQVGR